MVTLRKTLRVCDKGHKYYKSSDCPVCPICADEEKPKDDFLATLGAPARRALMEAGILTVEDLGNYSEAQLLKLHGIGPSSIPKLKDALKASGLNLKG